MATARQAVVIGAGIAGLLAARALADAFEDVVVLDRDELVGGPRRCVPQGRHLHALLAAGTRAIEQLLPGLVHDLAAAGAVRADGHRDAQWVVGGRAFARAPSDLQVLASTRPFLEDGVRARVGRLTNVTIRPSRKVGSLALRGGRVVGVVVDGETLPADLVVEAGGRGSKLPRWLAASGYEPAAEEGLDVGVGYTTAELRLPDDLLDVRAAIVGATPESRRSGVLQQVEHGAWILSLGAYGASVPTDRDAMLAHARALPSPLVHEALRHGEIVGEPARFSYPRSYRRRYERLARLPEGLVAIGDAMCSFNPVYAQGMTVAALQALALRDELARGVDGAPRRFFAAAARIAEVPWRMAGGSDRRLLGHARALPARLLDGWLGRVLAAAEHDPRVAAAFLRVASFVDPPTRLLAPSTAWRVLAPRPRPALEAATS